MKIINKIIEPQRVLVIWQAPDKASQKPTGTRFVVGEITRVNGEARLRYFDNAEVKEAETFGFTGLTSYPYESNREYVGNLEDVLSKRLPPETRTDYADYLQSYRLPPNLQNINPITLLAYTTGKLAGDGFTFFHTFEEASPPFDFMFEIAGFRHNGLNEFPNPALLQDNDVNFVHECNNQHDNGAIAVFCQEKRLGYIPKGLAEIVKTLMEKYKISASIERINGTTERPSILVFVEVR
jgi:hypothetical protein